MIEDANENSPSTFKFEASERLLRLKSVLERYPVSRSRWYEGIKTGEYPKAIRLGLNSVAWKESDIERLIAKAVAESEQSE